MSFNNLFSLGDIYYRAQLYDKAIETFKAMQKKYPESYIAREMEGACYFMEGEMSKAGKIFRKVLPLPERISIYQFARYVFLYKSGQAEPVQVFLDHLYEKSKVQWVSPAIFAFIYFITGFREKAVHYFQKGVAEKDPAVIICGIDPLWSDFKADPVVRDTLKKIGLKS